MTFFRASNSNGCGSTFNEIKVCVKSLEWTVGYYFVLIVHLIGMMQVLFINTHVHGVFRHIRNTPIIDSKVWGKGRG